MSKSLESECWHRLSEDDASRQRVNGNVKFLLAISTHLILTGKFLFSQEKKSEKLTSTGIL